MRGPKSYLMKECSYIKPVQLSKVNNININFLVQRDKEPFYAQNVLWISLPLMQYQVAILEY